MSKIKKKESEGSYLGDGAKVLGGGLRTIWKAMRDPRYGWLVSVGVGFLLGVVYGVFFL